MSLIDDHRASLAAANTIAVAGVPLPHAPRPSPRCTYCGSTPTAFVDFRAQRGYGLFRRVRTFVGPFCRDCGLAMFRKSTATTLVAGWFGLISLVTTPGYLISNLTRRRHVARLAAPQGNFDGASPLPPGRSIFLRWQILGLVLPVAIAALVVGEVNRAVDNAVTPVTHVGSCVADATSISASIVNCGQSHDGVVTAIVTSISDCPASTTATGTAADLDSNFVVCIRATS